MMYGKMGKKPIKKMEGMRAEKKAKKSKSMYA